MRKQTAIINQESRYFVLTWEKKQSSSDQWGQTGKMAGQDYLKTH